MKSSINLVPSKNLASGSYIQAALVLKQFTLIGVVLLTIMGVIGVLLMVLFSAQLSTLDQKIAEIKKEISLLQPIEQKLVLLKDRSEKAKSVLTNKNEEKLANLDTLVLALPSDISLNFGSIDSAKSNVNFESVNSSSFVEFLKTLFGLNLYDRVILETFSFNPETGYLFSVEVP